VAPVTVLVTSAIVVALEVEMVAVCWADAMATRHREKRTISNFIVER
jgi:hypothetical protein